MKWVHRISNVDPETRMGDCAHCGRVRVKYKAHKDRWVCGVKWTEQEKKRKPSHCGPTPEHPTRKPCAGYRSGVCPLCSKHSNKLVQDHDHKTGKLREWICMRCNKIVDVIEDGKYSPYHRYIVKHSPR